MNGTMQFLNVIPFGIEPMAHLSVGRSYRSLAFDLFSSRLNASESYRNHLTLAFSTF